MTNEKTPSALAWLRRKYPTEWQASEADISAAKQATKEAQRDFKARFSGKKVTANGE